MSRAAIIMARHLVVFLLTICTVWPGIATAQTQFDRHDYTRQELIFLQAALAFQGQYSGLLDGDWGRRSQSALDDYTATRGDLTHLVREFESERRTSGWARINNDAAGVSMVLPIALLAETGEDDRYLTYATPSRDLLVRWIADTRDGTFDMHAWARQSHVGAQPAYTSDRSDRIITSATLDSGRRVYLRSWLRGRAYITLLIQSTPTQYNRAALIASSLTPGTAPDLAPTPGGQLAALLRTSRPDNNNIARAPDHAAPFPVARPSPSQQVQATGTGFFVNATDVVTAAHVIDDCSALTLADGTPLTLLSKAADSDLAVLQAAQRSAHWLPLRSDPDLRLGQGVAAVGYPFMSFSGGALNLTMGNVSALSVGGAHPDWVAISAPVQPGNSGGPLLSDMGEVVGVVVARANDDFYLRETGTLPQNINFAVRLARLRRFLQDAAIPLPADTHDTAAPLSDGLSSGKQAAIQPILCY